LIDYYLKYENFKIPKCPICGKDLKIKKGIIFNKTCGDEKCKSKVYKSLKHTEDTKKILSTKRQNYLKLNPDEHVWKRHDKFKSNPCELLKSKFIENNINFLSELTLDPDITINHKNYSIDIAFPNEKIGIEVNGNQHYNSDGTLKEYYKKRNEFFIENGWKIYQIHYSKVYDNDFVNDLIQKLRNNYDIGDIDYSFYIRHKKEHYCKVCNKNKVSSKDVMCKSCLALSRRKVERPNKEELINLVNSNGLEATGRKYGVTGNAIKKWLKTEKIMKFSDFNLYK